MNASIEGTKNLLRDLLVWDANEKQHMLRANMAKQLGLSPDQYTRPFPGSSTVIVMNEPQQQPTPPAPEAKPADQPAAPAASPLPAVAGAVAAAAPKVAGAMLGGWVPALVVAGASLVAGWTASRLNTTTTTQQVEPVTLEVRWQQGPDGKWTTVTPGVKP